MKFFRRYHKKPGYYFYLAVLLLLEGCGRNGNIKTEEISESFQEESDQEKEIPAVQEEKVWQSSYELTKEDLIQWDDVQETETEDYFIVQETEEETAHTMWKEDPEQFIESIRRQFARIGFYIRFADRWDKEEQEDENPYPSHNTDGKLEKAEIVIAIVMILT